MKTTKTIQSVDCACTGDHGLFIPNRQVSFILGGTAGFFFVTFLAGYFLGKQQQIVDFSTAMEQIAQAQLPSDSNDNDSLPLVQGEPHLAQVLPPAQTPTLKVEPASAWYAQLIGYGTSPAAHRFAQKLQKKGVAVGVKTRYSKTPKGREITWYQVSTEPHADREALEQLVEHLSRTEHLTGVRIVSC